MATLSAFLPAPKHAMPQSRVSLAMEVEAPVPTTAMVSKTSNARVRPYGQRSGWIPRTQEDFGDGGAFPEIHVAQYPLDMGRKDSSSSSQQKSVPLTLDAQGRIKFEAIIPYGSEKNVFARPENAQTKGFTEEDLKRPDPEEEAEITSKTKQALEHVVNGRIAAAQPTNVLANAANVNNAKNQPTYIRYTPAKQAPEFNSGAGHRIIRLTEMPTDPMEPPKFKNKKLPRGPPSPPVPVMHSPPRKVTVKDQQDWKIPPCISNWKNNKGYTIPLDKRLAADGRGLNEFSINDNFAKLSESLYIAERKAREEVAARAEIEKKLKLREKEKKRRDVTETCTRSKDGKSCSTSWCWCG